MRDELSDKSLVEKTYKLLLFEPNRVASRIDLRAEPIPIQTQLI
jgi:hypothetical protein